MSEVIRVLHVVNKMNRAGLENRLMDIYRNINKDEIQFDFFTYSTDEGAHDDEISSLGGVIYYNPPLKLQNILSIPMNFCSFLKKHPEYFIVHCHLNQWCGLILKGATNADIPVRIAHARTALSGCSLKNIIKNVIKLSTNKYATHKFAVSKKAGEWLYGKRAVANNEIEVWPNAIEFEKFQFNAEIRKEVREELKLGDSKTLIHIGNYRKVKNHIFLFNVFKEVLVWEPNAKLILLGADDNKGSLKKLIAKNKLAENVLQLGSRSDVERLLQAADIFVFPSKYEGFPGAVVEAQAAGLPCVISSNITSEVAITPLVIQLSLTKNTNQWREVILNNINTKRKIYVEYFEAEGFGIKKLAANYEKFYKIVSKGEACIG